MTEYTVMDNFFADYAVIILYAVLALTGLIGNFWVMMTVSNQLFGTYVFTTKGKDCPIRRQKSLGRSVTGVQSSACIYLLMLSVVDLISFVPVPLLAVDILENRWPYGISVCKLLYACEAVNKSLSPLILTALSVDRYIAVCRPTFMWMRRSRFACLVIFVCSMISFLFILPVTAHATVSVIPDFKGDEHRKCVVQMSRTFDLLHSVTCYVLPLFFICSVYVAILRRLYEHTRRSSMASKTTISLSRVVKCSVMVVAFYFICWTPYWGMRILSLFAEDPQLQPQPAFDLDLPESPMHLPKLQQNLTDKLMIPYADDAEMNEFTDFRHMMLLMYLVHALPYTQSAFNWLFYAFLNKNLRHSHKLPQGTRSALTSTPIENGHGNLSFGTGTPIWRNIQSMGVYLKANGLDPSHSLLKLSPFKSKRIRSRSTTCLESLPDTTRLKDDHSHLSTPLTSPRCASTGNCSPLKSGRYLTVNPKANLLSAEAPFFELPSDASDVSGNSQTPFCSVRRATSERRRTDPLTDQTIKLDTARTVPDCGMFMNDIYIGPLNPSQNSTPLQPKLFDPSSPTTKFQPESPLVNCNAKSVKPPDIRTSLIQESAPNTLDFHSVEWL
ncbi:unnamed protein product [Bursaphelenchus xylophilus]|uniref:(pine wood nematode) hypothetical protein n=1 Tax=Bursaphelenchus xylophilus TaxID=6326 RepID=A0A1I7RUR4_BURXY|nr:unnamed protein product [Bursaphelenchus xylophilus]CAG9105554.1 unnamed protein product [Bursaphelenchus xylophilus]